ncbi:hypothetical protein GCM10023196_055180 [Actinoallomurus vinaceus]|uniref:HTH cro/C1-type domain-containing protein n=1 Tax=Actinoallomurus vinaceus TaxID=1080074 RepID=A0ABP8UGC4_9ACTN
MAGYPGFGVLLARLSGHRNPDVGDLSRLAGAGETDWRLYLPAVKIQRVGCGRLRPTLDLVAGLATALGVRADDMAALIGVELPGDTPPRDPAGIDVAELIWDVRRLTADQVLQACDAAKSMGRGRPRR